MKVTLTKTALAALDAFLGSYPDAELLSAKGDKKEYVIDIYDREPPVSMDLVLTKDALCADGAATLSFDEELDGWYIDADMTDMDAVVAALREAGAPI